MASQTPFASNSNNHRYHNHNRQNHIRQCFPRLSSRRNSSCSYGPTPSTVNEPAVQNASVPAPNPVKNLETLPRVHVGAPVTTLTQDSAKPEFQSPSSGAMNNACDVWRRTELNRYGHNGWHTQGNVQFRAVEEHRMLNADIPNCPGSTEMHVPDPSMNQFTPEQQQWMYLSQQTQNFLPFTQNVLTQFGGQSRNPGLPRDVSMPGKSCEEIEREQTLHVVPPERCALCQLGRINQNAPAPPVSASYPSVPTAPMFKSNWPSLPLEGPLDQQSISALHKMAESLYYELHGLYLIPFKKEECPLNATGQCPFGFSCFFEHPERGTGESGKGESGEDEGKIF